jgi:AcrR family transcriptional regulator
VTQNESARQRPRASRADGERSRATILDAAARLATVEGIEGLSIARLADAVGMSKSGLFAHFRSKEELQLATVDKASAVFFEQVVDPAMTAGTAMERLRRLVYGYLTYVEVDTFPGGCFFASVLAEVDMQPGAVRDRLVSFLAEWLNLLETAVRDAQAQGAIDPGEDSAQIAFELEAALLLANAQHVVTRSQEPIERARRAVDRRLASTVASARE